MSRDFEISNCTYDGKLDAVRSEFGNSSLYADGKGAVLDYGKGIVVGGKPGFPVPDANEVWNLDTGTVAVSEGAASSVRSMSDTEKRTLGQIMKDALQKTGKWISRHLGSFMENTRKRALAIAIVLTVGAMALMTTAREPRTRISRHIRSHIRRKWAGSHPPPSTASP